MGNREEMVVGTIQGIKAANADELGAELVSGPKVNVPSDARERTNSFMDNYAAFLADRAEVYGERLKASRFRKPGQVQPQIGEPRVGSYVALDVLSLSPIELFGFGPLLFQPQKIIASGTLCVSVAVIWINPFVDVPNGFAVPANIQLGNRTARLSFDHFNLTTGIAGPNVVFNIPLGPAPVPSIIPVPMFFVSPPVGSPELIEQHVTLDIVQGGQPYAAFGTQVLDVDAEPSWLFGFPPAVPAQLEHDIPTKYMVYPQ